MGLLLCLVPFWQTETNAWTSNHVWGYYFAWLLFDKLRQILFFIKKKHVPWKFAESCLQTFNQTFKGDCKFDWNFQCKLSRLGGSCAQKFLNVHKVWQIKMSMLYNIIFLILIMVIVNYLENYDLPFLLSFLFWLSFTLVVLLSIQCWQ